jgi:hypothetical protein
MVVLRTITTTGCPTEKHADALKLAAQTLAELAGRSQAQVATITTFDAAVDAIAALIPDSSNITFASSLPAEMRRVVEECALFYTPRERPHTANLNTANQQLVVDTLDERDARDKYIIIGDTKLWRSSEHPWTAWYAHHWVGFGVAGYGMWFTAYEAIVAGYAIVEHQQHRQKCCERLMRAWFELTSNIKTADELTSAHVKLFQSTVDLLAEGFLLRKGVTHAGGTVASTRAFAEILEKRRHDARPLDYFSDLAAARSTKESSKNLFRH